VSVLIPAYNAEATIGEAIASVLAQTFTDWELIVVDDASTDGTLETAQRYADDPRIRVYRNETRLGKWENHNRCAEFARGAFLKFLHAYDLLYPHGLACFVDLLAPHSDAVLSISGSSPLPGNTLLAPPDAWRHEFVGTPVFMLSPSTALFQRRAYLELGGFDASCAPPQRHLELRLSAQSPVMLCYPGLVCFGPGAEVDPDGDDSCGPLGVCAGYRWLDDLIAGDGCPLPPGERQRFRANLRIGVARRGFTMLRGGRLGALWHSWHREGIPWTLLWQWYRHFVPGGEVVRDDLYARHQPCQGWDGCSGRRMSACDRRQV
jgi:hypothetical protein